MITKLPQWIWWGVAILAFIAGLINAVGFLSFQHQGITHLTGTTTLLGVSLAQFDFAEAMNLLFVIGAFVAGAMLSGIVIQDGVLKLGRRYGAALLIETALLCLAVPLLHRHNVAGVYLASCACGLQNGMVSSYSGAVLRTSHVSGIFTDMGVFLGHCIRGVPVEWRRMRLWLAVIIPFPAGGIAGAWLFTRFSYETLYFPAGCTGLVGAGYSLYSQWHRRRKITSAQR